MKKYLRHCVFVLPFLFSAVLATGIAKAAVVDDYKPYQSQKGILHKIVYLDLDQTYMPLRPDDYLMWGLILAIVVVIIVLMLVIVKVKEIADESDKSLEEKNLREHTPEESVEYGIRHTVAEP